MPGWLLVLTFAVFTFYTDDYVVAGVLPEIARDLAVSEAAAGQLVTVFSLVVALAAPLAAVGTAPWRRRRLLTTALVLFVGANAAAAVTPGFEVLMGLRVLAALAAAMATPAMFALAATLAPPEKLGRYLGLVSVGVTGSIAAGVPLGTWIGGVFGWRATFAAVAVGGATALVAVLASVPEQRPPAPPPLREQLRTLSRRPVSLGLVANAVTITGSMMMLTYFGPFTREVAGAGQSARALLFALAGIAGVVCIWAGGRATDRWGPDRALSVGMATLVGSIAVLGLFWLARPVPLWLLGPVSLVWGGAAFFNAPAIQARLLRLAGPVGTQALVLNTTSTYLGVALAGGLGGVVLAGSGVGGLAPASALLGLLALAVFRLATAASRDPVA
ncbi:MFS transporter [Pseudonocardia eucalypti]|uniref:MFS transporter n=1 Tax=Pseudonocardia eucalypti TaxID=648755 RepID=A0ABP9Q3E5_9PSEU|nr:putative MFS family arabinose efflux permease [Pseudonocardia eucalypti]